MNCIQNQVTIRNRVLMKNRVAAFIITGGQDNVQAVAGQMLGFFAEIGCVFPQFPYIAHSRFGAKLERPNVELPDHAVGHGATFDADPNDLSVLAGYYAHAAMLLEAVKDSPVRCWPHHFDIAALHMLGDGKTIGIGLSPGDDSIREPYWYVNLWPYPHPSRLRPLRFGMWYTEGWTGAVMEAAKGPQYAEIFVREATEHCRILLA